MRSRNSGQTEETPRAGRGEIAGARERERVDRSGTQWQECPKRSTTGRIIPAAIERRSAERGGVQAMQYVRPIDGTSVEQLPSGERSMNQDQPTTSTKLRAIGAAFALAALVAGGVLSGCGSSSNSSSVESSAKKQVEAGTKEVEEGVKEGTKATEKAIEEAKKQLSGKGSAQVKSGLKQAEKGIEQGKAQAESVVEATKKKIEEETK
jgi:hypothetical protein